MSETQTQMQGPTVTDSMTAAWLRRYMEATLSLAQAEAAPALHDPERVRQTRVEAAEAERQYRSWTEQGRPS